MKWSGRKGFALMAVLMVTLLVTALALTAASLALLSRRTSASALAMTAADALAEGDPPILPVPAVEGTSLSVPGPHAVPGWSVDWTVTRLGGDLLMVRSEARRLSSTGDELARGSLSRLFLCCDSLPPIPLPGGWLGAL
jgi:hypothetical protein